MTQNAGKETADLKIKVCSTLYNCKHGYNASEDTQCSRSVKFEDQEGLSQDAGSVRSLLSGKGMTRASFTWTDVPLLVEMFVRMFALGCSAGGRTWIRGLWTVDANSLRLLSRSLISACQGIQEMAHSSARMRTHGRTVGVSVCKSFRRRCWGIREYEQAMGSNQKSVQLLILDGFRLFFYYVSDKDSSL